VALARSVHWESPSTPTPAPASPGEDRMNAKTAYVSLFVLAAGCAPVGESL
jgi:hypothetical protein